MFVKVKNLPNLKLADLLRRKKMTLERFVQESGVQTYAGLVIRCQRIGVLPPSEEEFNLVHPEQVSSQSDGVIILPPIDEIFEDQSPDESPPKRKRKKQIPDEQ